MLGAYVRIMGLAVTKYVRNARLATRRPMEAALLINKYP